MSTLTKQTPLDAMWVRFGDGCITGHWAFEPFPPDMCRAEGIHKFVREIPATSTPRYEVRFTNSTPQWMVWDTELNKNHSYHYIEEAAKNVAEGFNILRERNAEYEADLAALRARLEKCEAERDDLKNAGGPPFIRSEAIRNLRDQVCGLKEQLATAERERDEQRQRVTAAVAAIEGFERIKRELNEAKEALGVERGWVASLTRDNGLLLEAADKTKAGRRCVDLHGRNEKLTADLAAAQEDSARLDALEALIKEKRYNGVSFDYCRHTEDGRVLEKGFRIMWQYMLGERKETLRAAIDSTRVSDTPCPNDTDGDGDCHLCHKLPGGCAEYRKAARPTEFENTDKGDEG